MKITVAVVVALMAVGGVALSMLGERSALLRYKVTATLVTDEGVTSGYAVQEVRATAHPTLGIPQQVAITWQVRGQAVALPLHDGTNAYVMLQTTSGAGTYALQVLRRCGMVHDYRDQWAQVDAISMLEGICNENMPFTPIVALFDDESDPSSMRLLDAPYGSTASQKITYRVEIVEEAVSTGLDERFPWVAYDEKQRIAVFNEMKMPWDGLSLVRRTFR